MTAATLAVQDIACWFDVKPSWIDRTFLRKPVLTIRAVDGLSFAIPRGTTFSIVGESGCGKSTLARLVVGLYRPTQGTITFAKGAGRDGNVRTQMIFQDPYASLNPRWTVGRIIAEPIRELGLRSSGEPIRARVAGLLEQVGLKSADRDRFPHEFSGGQRQRISIARALAAEPEFIVCDEPTSALDVSVQAQILNLLADLQRELGLTYLFISHNLAVVRHISDRVGVMYLGRLVEQGPTAAVFEQPQHPYTQFLLETVPNLQNPDRNRQTLAADLPSALDIPPGCAFNPRCPRANALCRTETPSLTAHGPSIVACHHIDAPTTAAGS